MQKRVFIIHCLQGTPNDFWYPWLKKELEKKGFEVCVPEMPDTNRPKIGPWVSTLKLAVGKIDNKTYFVGHSIGCQTILRLLEQENSAGSIGGAVFVAPWLTLKELTDDEVKTTKPWLRAPMNSAIILKYTQDKLTAIFSKDDPYVSIENAEEFKNRFGAKIIIEDGLGHFDDESMTELPVVLEELLKMAK